MISLRGLTDHTMKSYQTYISAYLNYIENILCKTPSQVSYKDQRRFLEVLQRERNLSDRTINVAISQLRFFTLYVLHKPWDDTQLAISNSRIISVTDTHTTFSSRGRKPGDSRRTITFSNEEFIRRFLMHVLPTGFQKVRYYGFLNNRMKSKNLKLIFKLQGYQKFKQRYTGLGMAELIKQIWKKDICCYPQCGHSAMRLLGRTHGAFG